MKPGEIIIIIIIIINTVPLLFWSRDSIVGMATGYGLDDRGVGNRVPIESRIFSSRCRPYLLWGPPNLLSNGYQGLLPRGYSGRDVNLTTLQLLQ
jgi:hypothetical protein